MFLVFFEQFTFFLFLKKCSARIVFWGHGLNGFTAFIFAKQEKNTAFAIKNVYLRCVSKQHYFTLNFQYYHFMKKVIILFFILTNTWVFAQNSLGSINANAVSTTAYSHTIGDIYVVPSGSAPSNSGMMGVFSGIRAQLVAIETTSENAPKAYFYPNPVQNVLNLGIKNRENERLTATVFDITGRTMLTQTVQNGQIDLSALLAGAYLVQLVHESEQISFKIVKQ
jgi:Secretion system C-terminal sorting domain